MKITSSAEFEEVLENIQELVEQGQLDYVRNILADLHPADIADLIEHLEPEYRERVFSLLPPETGAEVLAELKDVPKEDVLEALDSSKLAEVISEMDSDDATDVVSELPEEKATEVLEKVEDATSEEIEELLGYEEDTAGGLMAKEIFAINANATVAEAIKELRRLKMEEEEVEELYRVYVVDDFGKLVGAVSVVHLILSDPQTKIKDIMDHDVIAIQSDMDQEEVAQIFKKYDLVSAPVVNKNYKLIGRITIDDILDVIEEETDEDLARIAGTGEEEILEDSVLKISRARLPWLMVSFIGEIASAFILENFSATLAQIVASAFFIPIVMALGGSSGQQSAIIVVRGLATGEIALMDLGSRIWREFRASLLNGIVIALLIFSVVSLWQGDRRFALILSGTLIIVVMNATIFGAIIPFFLKKINVDPAIATGPFVATFNDVVGLLIYFSLLKFSFHYFF